MTVKQIAEIDALRRQVSQQAEVIAQFRMIGAGQQYPPWSDGTQYANHGQQAPALEAVVAIKAENPDGVVEVGNASAQDAAYHTLLDSALSALLESPDYWMREWEAMVRWCGGGRWRRLLLIE